MFKLDAEFLRQFSNQYKLLLAYENTVLNFYIIEIKPANSTAIIL